MGLFRRNKNTNKPLIKQIVDLIPHCLLNEMITKHQSDKGCSKYKTYDHYRPKVFKNFRTIVIFSLFSHQK